MREREEVTFHVLRFPRDAARWHLVHDFLTLRKDVFVDRMHWRLHSHGATEFEQYDHFRTTYVIATAAETGKVVGGARLLRTDHVNDTCSGRVHYSYMIRDAARGLLDGLPKSLLDAEPPQDARSWELTRLVSVGGASVSKGILEAVNRFLTAEGARRCLFLGPPAFLRMAAQMGFEPRRLGPVVGNESGRFLAFSCDVIRDGLLVHRSHVA
ncbi:MAG: hypothetical protein KDK08_14465 [Rhizobiaceae bacterium]|nr:hypothetical protein [Rhizobiaceae bacterium]